MSNNRTVLLTGANGFVGSRVARVLAARRCNVVALVRRPPDAHGWADSFEGMRFEVGDFQSRGMSIVWCVAQVRTYWSMLHGT